MSGILSHYAWRFCITVPGKDMDFVPLSAMFLVLGCTCNTNALMAWLGWSSNGMLSNMNVAIVWARMFL